MVRTQEEKDAQERRNERETYHKNRAKQEKEMKEQKEKKWREDDDQRNKERLLRAADTKKISNDDIMRIMSDVPRIEKMEVKKRNDLQHTVTTICNYPELTMFYNLLQGEGQNSTELRVAFCECRTMFLPSNEVLTKIYETEVGNEKHPERPTGMLLFNMFRDKLESGDNHYDSLLDSYRNGTMWINLHDGDEYHPPFIAMYDNEGQRNEVRIDHHDMNITRGTGEQQIVHILQHDILLPFYLKRLVIESEREKERRQPLPIDPKIDHLFKWEGFDNAILMAATAREKKEEAKAQEKEEAEREVREKKETKRETCDICSIEKCSGYDDLTNLEEVRPCTFLCKSTTKRCRRNAMDKQLYCFQHTVCCAKNFKLTFEQLKNLEERMSEKDIDVGPYEAFITRAKDALSTSSTTETMIEEDYA
jgi:hypothetical protein